MDYEKKYNEAIERMRKMLGPWRELAYNGKTFLQDLESIFPELRESEDERIRKELIDFVNHYRHNTDLTTEQAEWCKKAIAYLEKQKEQSHDGKKWIYEDDYHKDMERCFNDGKDEVLENPGKYGLQKEHKPTPDWMPRFLDELRSKKNYFDWDEHRELEGHILAIINWIAPDYFNRKEQEQKPAECIEFANEFENQVSRLLASVLNGEYEYNEGFVKHVAQSLLGYAKKEQKPAEWSEEDEYCRNQLIVFCENCMQQDSAAIRCANWLKSLRPSWKPSEEQMEAFKGYIEDLQSRAEAAVGGWNNFDVMIRLYEKLKKL